MSLGVGARYSISGMDSFIDRFQTGTTNIPIAIGLIIALVQEWRYVLKLLSVKQGSRNAKIP